MHGKIVLGVIGLVLVGCSASLSSGSMPDDKPAKQENANKSQTKNIASKSDKSATKRGQPWKRKLLSVPDAFGVPKRSSNSSKA